MKFTSVRKREGQIVPFDQSRITQAVFKAMEAAGEGEAEDAQAVSDRILKELAKQYPDKTALNIEEIQDVVETTLILMEYAKTAKAYILYRRERAALREKRKEIPDRVKRLVAESRKYFRDPLSEFIFYRSYSRWIEEEGRRETWVEAVQRYMDFMKENIGGKLDDEEYKEIQNAVLRQEVMPSMRLLWSAGKAARSSNACAYNCSFIAPSQLKDFGEIMYLSMCGTGVGFSVEQQNIQKLPQIKYQNGKNLPTHGIEDSKQGWAEACVLGLKTWFDGKGIDFDYSKIRPAGARLKTMGGRSSGPGPLRELMEFSRRKILANQGRRLKPIDVHDIICKIGEIVVSGGVRRSALISLSDLDDSEMRLAKSGQFFLTDPQRSMANNSVAYKEKPNATQFLEEWIALAKNGTGERGIFNRAGLEKQLPARRWKIFKKDAATSGTNPCVTTDTWVITGEGPKQVKDLINKPFTAVVNGQSYISSGFFETGNKEVFEVRTNRGFTLRATANHLVLVVDYRSQKLQRNTWKKVQELKSGDEIILQNHANLSWNGRGIKGEGWLLGNLLGDGNIEKSGKANLDYWGINQPIMTQKAVALVHASVEARSDLIGHLAKTGFARVGSMGLGRLAASYGLGYANKTVTDQIEEASSDFCEGFLSGWFDADGSVQGNQQKGVSIRLSSSSLANLEKAQRMLARLGIIGTIYKNRHDAGTRLMPDGHGGMKEYCCQANHELIISGANLFSFFQRINFSDPDKRFRLQEAMKNYHRKLNRESFSSRVTEIISIGKQDVYDCAVSDINAFDANGFYVHNCGEIILRSKEFCNLSEVVCRREDTLETLAKKIRLATILGTYQSMLTDFDYLSKEWKKNCEEERLLGVSLTGQWDCPAARDVKNLAVLKAKAIEINKEYANRLGINQSVSITCVKPSGTVSQLVDAASGMHPRHAKYYIRRVRVSSTDSLFQMMKDQKVPYYPEAGQSLEAAHTYVLEFPVKAPEGAVLRNDLSALDQLHHWKKVKEYYTEHNPSVTVSVGAGEWIRVADWLYENWEMIGGLSFLPREEHVYALAPYEEISKETYETMAAKFPRIDFSQILLYEKDDETQGSKELACAGGVCEIV